MSGNRTLHIRKTEPTAAFSLDDAREINKHLSERLEKYQSKTKRAGKMLAVEIAKKKRLKERIKNLLAQYADEMDNTQQTLEAKNIVLENALNEMKSDSLTDIFFAHVRAGNIEKIRAALLLNPSLINARDRSESALHIACYNDQVEAAKILLEYEPELFLKLNNRRRTAIEEMAAKDNIGMLNMLSEQRIKLLAKYQDDQTKETFLHNLKVLSDKFLATFRQTSANARVYLENKLFFAAVSQNDLTKIQSLMHYMPDINIKNKSGETALHMAVGLGNLEMVKYLLEKGADPLIKWQGENTLYYATRLPYNRKEIVEAIQNHLFLKEATYGSWGAMKLAMENGANIRENLNGALRNAIKAYEFQTVATDAYADPLEQAAALYEAVQPQAQNNNNNPAPHRHTNGHKTVIRNVLKLMGQFGIQRNTSKFAPGVLEKPVIRSFDGAQLSLGEYVAYTEGKSFRK